MDTPNEQLITALNALEQIRRMPIVDKLKNIDTAVYKAQELIARTLVDYLSADPSGLTPEEMALSRAGQKIPAIRSIRNRLGLGLMDAKEMVEKWQRENGVDPFGGQR